MFSVQLLHNSMQKVENKDGVMDMRDGIYKPCKAMIYSSMNFNIDSHFKPLVTAYPVNTAAVSLMHNFGTPGVCTH